MQVYKYTVDDCGTNSDVNMSERTLPLSNGYVALSVGKKRGEFLRLELPPIL